MNPVAKVAACHGNIDFPLDNFINQSDVLIVSGWCLFDDSSVSRIEIFINNQIVDCARIFIPHHLEHLYSHADAPVGGFHCAIKIPQEVREQPMLVEVVAHSLDGRSWQPEARSVSNVLKAEDQPNPTNFIQKSIISQDRIPDSTRSKVAFFTHTLTLGGGQLWLQELIRQMMRYSEQDFIVFSSDDGPLSEILLSWGVEVRITSSYQDIATAEKYEGKISEQILLLQAFDIGVVLINTLGLFATVDAASRINIPTIWCIHESFELCEYIEHAAFNGLDSHVIERFEHCFQLATGLIYEARQTAALFEEFSSGSNEYILDYGIDLPAIDSFLLSENRETLRESYGYGDNDLVILSLGTFEPRKAQANVIRAFDELADSDSRIQLVLVGSTGDNYSQHIERQIARSRNSNRIKTEKVTSEYFDWMMISDIFLSASDVESLPRSIIEAMAFSLPIISTDVFGIPNLISDRASGWLTTKNDLSALIATLAIVTSQTVSERKAIGSKAREVVEQRHEGLSYGNRLGFVIRDLLGDADVDCFRWIDRVWVTKSEGATMENPIIREQTLKYGSKTDQEIIDQLERLCERLRTESEQTTFQLILRLREANGLNNLDDRWLGDPSSRRNLEIQIESLSAEITAMKLTRSWRLMGPLRKLRQLIQ